MRRILSPAGTEQAGHRGEGALQIVDVMRSEAAQHRFEAACHLREVVDEVQATQGDPISAVEAAPGIEQDRRQIDGLDLQGALRQRQRVATHAASDLEHPAAGRDARELQCLVEVAPQIGSIARNHGALAAPLEVPPLLEIVVVESRGLGSALGHGVAVYGGASRVVRPAGDL